MKKVKLGQTTVTQESLPYIIAEIGVNHEGSIEQAFELIRQAKRGGAHAAKYLATISKFSLTQLISDSPVR